MRTLSSVGGASVLTYHNDSARTGQNLAETILRPDTVSVSSFGKVGFFTTDGKVDAQPLLLPDVPIPGQGTHNVVYVVTEHDSVYAFDSDSGAVLWRISTLGAGEVPSDGRNCSQVTPEIGITSTPVIDPSRGPNGVIYVVAMSKSGSSYIHRLHALDVTTGAELFGGPKMVQASVSGHGSRQFRRHVPVRSQAIRGAGWSPADERKTHHGVEFALRHRSLHGLDHGVQPRPRWHRPEC